MKKPVHVLFISHDSSLYGAQLSLLGLLQKLDRNRFKPWVVAHHEGPLTVAIRNLNIPVILLPIVHWIAAGKAIEKPWFHRAKTFTRGLRGRAWALAHLIERHNIDIVYTNTITCIEGAIAAKMTHRPHVWHLREQVKGNSQLRALLPSFMILGLIHALSWRVLVNSRHLYRAYAYYPLRNKLAIIYNGIDTEKFDIDRESASYALRSELDIPKDHKIVAIIGSIIPRKGLFLFADAASYLVVSLSDVTFLVVGDGPSDYVRLVQNRVREHGLERNFRFVGCRSDIPRILAGVNLAVTAADEEPFGRTVIEAMAAGVPVVSTKCGGPEEIIIDGVTGLLVPLGGPSQMAQAIKRILSDPEHSTSLAAAGRDRVNQKFTLQAYADNVQSQLESVNRYYGSADKI
ncbi:glycosyltransferase family 4 protein [Methylobacter marinus]|uniref:glycosyltransferase family 4 protein n=1 Tax=Methylobacter marinus TaxID=34058 RepID=UPI00037D5F77|nr:glycosyltransferase family 4 protein [Methylobacter marinus]